MTKGCVRALLGVCIMAALGATSRAAAQTEWFAADATGIQLTPTLPDLRIQIGPAAYDPTHTAVVEGWPALNTAPGTLLTYVATPGLPQVAPGDISWSLYAIAVSGVFDGLTPVRADFVGGFRFFPMGGSADDGSILEHGTFTGTAWFYDVDRDLRLDYADIDGLMVADPGTLQPAGWPEPADWWAGTPARLTGRVYHVDGPETFVGRLESVPEPGPLATLAGAALGGLGVLARRLRRR